MLFPLGSVGHRQGARQTTSSHWVRAPLRGSPLRSSSKMPGMAETLGEIVYLYKIVCHYSEVDNMDKCIYLGKLAGELTYNSQEHLIPAGLGGILKLPKGFVSDQANNKFSKYELCGLRKSLLTGNRMRHGPGKRGNQNIKKKHL